MRSCWRGAPSALPRGGASERVTFDDVFADADEAKRSEPRDDVRPHTVLRQLRGRHSARLRTQSFDDGALTRAFE